MATRFTYEDFERELANRGMGGQFSAADMSLAKSNPDAGMSLLNYKSDYANATTDEARALANEGAESIRSAYGNYTGGIDGSGFYLDQPSPGSFAFAEVPKYNNKYADSINKSYDKLSSFKDFSYDLPAPTYTDSYKDQREDIISQLQNPGEFAYDYETDPVYGAYAKQYRREGERASQNALAQAAAASGGMPSSYAVTAAQQAGNYYGAGLADKIPQLYSQAYDRWLNEFTQKQNALAALQGESQNEYDKYLNDLNQYNADRSFAYGQYQDEYNRLVDAINQGSKLEQLDYTKYLDELDQYNSDRNFAYNQLLDEISNQQALDQRAYERAWDAASVGDYSQLADRGINTERQQLLDALDMEAQRLGLAGEYAQYGDYSRLADAGVDISQLLYEQELARQNAALEQQYTTEQINDMIWNRDRVTQNDAYNREQDAYNRQLTENQLRYNREQDAYNRQLTEDQLRYNREQDALARQLELAQTAYDAGDASLLEAMGITPQTQTESDAITAAQILASIANLSGGKATASDYDVLLRSGYLTENGAPTDALTSYGMTDNDADALARKAETQMLSEDEWNRLKAYGYTSPITNFDSYADYAKEMSAIEWEEGLGKTAIRGLERALNR